MFNLLFMPLFLLLLEYKYPRLKRKGHDKASKGRKLKFQVHPKIVNFMAPETVFESSLATDELLSSLFGKNSI